MNKGTRIIKKRNRLNISTQNQDKKILKLKYIFNYNKI